MRNGMYVYISKKYSKAEVTPKPAATHRHRYASGQCLCAGAKQPAHTLQYFSACFSWFSRCFSSVRDSLLTFSNAVGAISSSSMDGMYFPAPPGLSDAPPMAAAVCVPARPGDGVAPIGADFEAAIEDAVFCSHTRRRGIW